MKWAIQLTENFGPHGEADAREALEALRDQDGFLGGRVLPDCPEKPGHKVQAFFNDEENAQDMWLPDGMRRVAIPTNLEGTLFAVGPRSKFCDFEACDGEPSVELPGGKFCPRHALEALTEEDRNRVADEARRGLHGDDARDRQHGKDLEAAVGKFGGDPRVAAVALLREVAREARTDAPNWDPPESTLQDAADFERAAALLAGRTFTEDKEADRILANLRAAARDRLPPWFPDLFAAVAGES